MRKLIIGVLMAATAFPAVASAQSYQDQRGDRQDARQQQYGQDQGRRHDDRRDMRQDHRDMRNDRQDDRNRAWARDDWRGWRDNNRNLYARGNWNAPFRYQNFRAGVRIAPNYYGQRYWIVDPWRYHLPPARPNTRWVRHYNDVLLIDYRRGIVIDVIRGFYM